MDDGGTFMNICVDRLIHVLEVYVRENPEDQYLPVSFEEHRILAGDNEIYSEGHLITEPGPVQLNLL